MIGGFALVWYYLLGMIVCCCVGKRFENYLASELYMATETGAKVAMEGEVQEVGEGDAGCCGSRTMVS